MSTSDESHALLSSTSRSVQDGGYPAPVNHGEALDRPLLSEEEGKAPMEGVEELDPHHASDKMTSFSETLINFLKGNICAGFLSLPFAFAQGGYVGGTVLLLFIASICVHCMLLLVKSKQRACADNGFTRLSYGQLAELAIGRYGTWIVNAALLVTQFGFCCVYIIFIAQHIREFSDRFSYQIYAVLIMPAVVLLTWIKDFKTIAPTSIFANLCMIYSCAVIFSYVFQNISATVPADPDCPLSGADGPALCLSAAKPVPWAGFSHLPIFFGNTVFAFESIGLVIPMENTIRDKSKFPLVVLIGMSIVVSLYILFALFGYLTFGDSVQGSITLNLPSNALFGSVKIALSLALFQSIGIQFFPPIGIIERSTQPMIKQHISSPKMRLVAQNGLRTLVIFMVAALAIAIPHLGLIISLIGSMGAGLLALILPPLMHIRLVPNLPLWVKVKDCLIICFGVVGSVAGIFVSIKELIAAS